MLCAVDLSPSNVRCHLSLQSPWRRKRYSDWAAACQGATLARGHGRSSSCELLKRPLDPLSLSRGVTHSLGGMAFCISIHVMSSIRLDDLPSKQRRRRRRRTRKSGHLSARSRRKQRCPQRPASFVVRSPARVRKFRFRAYQRAALFFFSSHFREEKTCNNSAGFF